VIAGGVAAVTTLVLAAARGQRAVQLDRSAAASSSDHTDPELENTGTGAFVENIALNVAHKFASAGAALLSCNSSGVTVDISSIKITAIKAGKLSIVSLQLV
jgi:hypothetical protein